jgi:hypothetical protein
MISQLNSRVNGEMRQGLRIASSLAANGKLFEPIGL